MRGSEVSRDHFIDPLARLRLNQVAEQYSASFERLRKPQHRRGDLLRFNSGNAHNSDPAASGGRSDGNDGVVEVHASSLSARGENPQASPAALAKKGVHSLF